ncbi:MAG: DUF58 domain-containing protein [Fibrobacter sp.]|nr:DUF58 domain-containing protein [Fibrobacter sp.]
MNSFLKWFTDSIPRAPRRPGLLMRLYYLWQECFTPAGHAAAALFPTAIFAGSVPNFWAAWVFCGLDFLLFLGLILSLFATSKLSKISIENVAVTPVFEGEPATVSALVSVHKSQVDSVVLGVYRMDSSLKCEESDPAKISSKSGGKVLECRIQTRRRGAFPLKKVAANVSEIMGLLRFPFPFRGSSELLVYPRPVKVGEFPFLTSGASGAVFAPLLMPSLTRGMNFVGVREYREGDSLRDLHHKAFARYGRPFTKEFETERGAGAILLLDTATPTVVSRSHLEDAIRLTAGIGQWLLERNILGRFFIDDEEIPLQGLNSRDLRTCMLEALARIPSAKITGGKKPAVWSPAARPMDPVLRVGLFAKDESLIHKHVVVGALAKSGLGNPSTTTVSDNTLWVDVASLREARMGAQGSSREVEVRL